MQERVPASAFVGRSTELGVFERAVEDARAGLPSVVLVGGDAGIGKTSLVRESATRAGVPIHLGRSTHIGGDAIPLAPLTDLVRQLRRSSPELVSSLSLDGSQGALFAAVLELVDQLSADGPVIVGFDDLHWADAVTWDLFEYLARNLIDEHVVLVGTFRATDVAADASQRARIAELGRLAATKRVQLEGLERDDIAGHIEAVLGAPPTKQLVDRVAARSGGNPFFATELVTAHESGEELPVVLCDLISTDVAALDDPSRQVLAGVSAIGRDVTHELLAAIVDTPDLEATLKTLIDARLLIVDHDAYRFRHPLVGEVVYADLLPPQRTRLHRRIADALQRQSADALRRGDRAGELALHLDRAGDTEAAFTALLAAADAAQTVAPGTAFAHLDRAFQLWDAVKGSASQDRCARLWQAAELATSTVGNDVAAVLARQAFEHGEPPRGASWGHERLGRYLWASGHLEESAVQFGAAATLVTRDEVADRVMVFAGLGQAELMSGHDGLAGEWCNQVFELVPAADANPAAWTMASRVLGVARSDQGDPQRGVELCRAAVAAAPHAQERALSSIYLCVALGDAAEHEAVVNLALDSVAEGHLAGLDRGFGCYLDSLAAEALVHLGRWTEADRVLARQPVEGTFPAGLVRLARVSSLLAARRGKREDALAALATADALPIDGWHRIVLDATIAEVHLALGDWSEAATAAARGRATVLGTSVLWAARFAALGIAAVVEQTLDRRARRETVDTDSLVADLSAQIDDVLEHSELVDGGPQRDTAAWLALGRASISRLTAPDADAWADAVVHWTEFGDRWWTAVALLREAEDAASSGQADRAASSLRRAHEMAAELGAAPLVTAIETVSARTRVSVEAPARVVLDDSSADRLGLTPREAEVLGLLAAGRTNRQIGEQLYVSDKTASVHVSNILRKLGVNSRVDAAAIAQRLGVT